MLGSVFLLPKRIVLRVDSVAISQQYPSDFLFICIRSVGVDSLDVFVRCVLLMSFIYNLFPAIKYFQPNIIPQAKRRVELLVGCAFISCFLQLYNCLYLAINMIKNIITSQKVGQRTFYLVQWAKAGQRPSWVTRQACPQIVNVLKKFNLPTEEPIIQQKSQNNSLPSEITEAEPIFEYLKWKSERPPEDKKEKELQKFINRQRRKGVERLNLSVIDRLRQKQEQLMQRIRDPEPTHTRLDYLIDSIEGVQYSKFNTLCFSVAVVDRAQKYIVPVDKMKKHFPKSLHDYLEDLIQVHIKEKSTRQLKTHNMNNKVVDMSKEKKKKKVKKDKAFLQQDKEKMSDFAEEDWDIDAVLRRQSQPHITSQDKDELQDDYFTL